MAYRTQPPSIYGLAAASDPERIRYVGQTKSTRRQRFLDHCARALKQGSELPVHQWIRDVTAAGDDVVVVLLEEEPPDGLNAAEQRWIATYRPDVLNADRFEVAHRIAHADRGIVKADCQWC